MIFCYKLTSVGILHTKDWLSACAVEFYNSFKNCLYKTENKEMCTIIQSFTDLTDFILKLHTPACQEIKIPNINVLPNVSLGTADIYSRVLFCFKALPGVPNYPRSAFGDRPCWNLQNMLESAVPDLYRVTVTSDIDNKADIRGLHIGSEYNLYVFCTFKKDLPHGDWEKRQV